MKILLFLFNTIVYSSRYCTGMPKDALKDQSYCCFVTYIFRSSFVLVTTYKNLHGNNKLLHPHFIFIFKSQVLGDEPIAINRAQIQTPLLLLRNS